MEQAIAASVKDLFKTNIEVVLTRPDEQFGDYSTNIALQLGNDLEKDSRDIAKQIADKILKDNEEIERTEVAGPGFINIWLTDKTLIKQLHTTPKQLLHGQTVVAEYSDPNPFKILHAGHLYTSVVGDAIANLLESIGAKVFRVNFGGDVGLHVGKTMWAILKELDGENPKKLNEIAKEQRAEWLTQRYIEGTKAYEENEEAKAKIAELNKLVYQLHNDNEHESSFAQIYWTTRQWSYDYFNEFYARIGSHFDKYYPESETAPMGLEKAKELLNKGILQESEGAVVFKGEDHGLHTRVFINSQGLPTYEAKDLGLTLAKARDYHPDKSVIITANDIVEYMKVVLKVIEQFDPGHAAGTTHLTHGMVKLIGGQKMSSRHGNILRATDVLDAVFAANRELNKHEDESTSLSAVKYAFLKNRLGGDIIYDPNESVALEGNSGPYLQYAHARARSVLAKLDVVDEPVESFEPSERSLLSKIVEFSEVVEDSATEYAPHSICTYLYKLSQIFNRFYEHNRVVGDPRQNVRAQLVQAYADTLKKGLALLNIDAPDSM